MIKIKKIVVLIVSIILIIFFLVLLGKRPRDYEISYLVNNYTIKEKYYLKDGVYSFSFQTGENDYLFDFKSNYYDKKKMVTSVTEDNDCLSFVVKTSKEKYYTICKKDGQYYTPFYDNQIDNNKIDSFEGIDIYNLDNHSYFVWNYNKLISLKKGNSSKINLFNSDVYNIDLYYQLDNYLILPDYNSKYLFSSLYLLNTDNLKLSKINLSVDLYFDSYFLGNYKDDIYLYDLKKETLYQIDPYNNEIKKSRYEYYDGNKWNDTNKKELNKKSIFFNEKEYFKFDVIDNHLVYKTPSYYENITNIKVDYLIRSNETEAFFINKDTLYYVNINKGIKKAISYKEWLYNKGNVFVF